MTEPSTPAEKLRVAVLFGGASTEHSISCVTAASVMAALDPARYEVCGIGITPQGRWVRFDGEQDDLRLRDGVLPSITDGVPVTLIGEANHTARVVTLGSVDAPPDQVVDVVFPLLHGPFGEDGTIQGMLELLGVPYVGSGVFASAAGMDKHFMKVVLAAADLPVLPYAVITSGQWEQDPELCVDRVSALGLPVFVKPARGGSSIGISKVSQHSELVAAIEAARECDPKVIVEATAGDAVREVECGVLGRVGESAQASAIAEITLDAAYDFYDFEAKYLAADAVSIDLPARLEPSVRQRIEELSVQAFAALECEGLARVDFFVLPGGEVALNEVNTMPGFTPSSMFPRMWAESGLAYAEVADRLIELALRRPLGLR